MVWNMLKKLDLFSTDDTREPDVSEISCVQSILHKNHFCHKHEENNTSFYLYKKITSRRWQLSFRLFVTSTRRCLRCLQNGIASENILCRLISKCRRERHCATVTNSRVLMMVSDANMLCSTDHDFIVIEMANSHELNEIHPLFPLLYLLSSIHTYLRVSSCI